ncbi:MAG TPA: CHAT domain-containing protein [Bryobacteraceae bacterium]|nr:CHAT domain-containing protein [Bryobacteraceae bacterium]
MTFVALSLTGSSRASAGRSDPFAALQVILEIQRLNLRGRALFASAEYSQARTWFLDAADKAQRFGDTRSAATNWHNAASCSLLTRQYRVALPEFEHARAVAYQGRQVHALLLVMNGLADFYLLTGQPASALSVTEQALGEPFDDSDRAVRARILCQRAGALIKLKRLDESIAYYLRGINALLDSGDYDRATRALAALGYFATDAGRLEVAEWALSQGLRISRLPGANGPGSCLTGLGQLRTAQRRPSEALRFFEAALHAPTSTMPRWRIYVERGKTRLNIGDFRGALQDFRNARRIVVSERADIVPADQDRVAFESGLGEIMEGLVNAGNSLARKTGDRAILEETFNTAEEDRQWSLRLLAPSPNDWRERLPARYWELLSQYQVFVRSNREKKAAEIEAELQRTEAAAAGSATGETHSESALQHVRALLDKDSVLFSFHMSQTGCWLWAIDEQGVDLYPLPAMSVVRARTAEFAHAIETNSPSTQIALQVYRDLFGTVAPKYLRHSRWSLELDGPLYELPFPALVTATNDGRPVYLAERASIQSVPDALLLDRAKPFHNGLFIGVGDPIYNTADNRYRGKRPNKGLSLSRLVNTAPELHAAAQSWNALRPIFLTGSDAEPGHLNRAISDDVAVIHFATHVIAEHGDFGSGMIALSLNQQAEMQFLGPKEIVSRPVRARLVVMNGCHSAQGEALQSAGLMGLTRAWIGAGAETVLATQWDVPDNTAQNFIVDLYTALRLSPEEPSSALRRAQLAAIRRQEHPSAWAGYSLLSRIL